VTDNVAMETKCHRLSDMMLRSYVALVKMPPLKKTHKRNFSIKYEQADTISSFKALL